MNRLRSLVLLSMCGLCSCSSVKTWFDLGSDDTETVQSTIEAEVKPKPTRSPASVNENPLRVMEYCALDNFARVIDCYPSKELCEKAARGFGMCSGR